MIYRIHIPEWIRKKPKEHDKPFNTLDDAMVASHMWSVGESKPFDSTCYDYKSTISDVWKWR